MYLSLPLTLPAIRQRLVDHHLAQWRLPRQPAGLASSLPQLGDTFMSELQQVLVGSDFVAEQLRRDPHMAWRLVEGERLWRSLAPGEVAELLAEALAPATTEDELARLLRRFRQQQQVR